MVRLSEAIKAAHTPKTAAQDQAAKSQKRIGRSQSPPPEMIYGSLIVFMEKVGLCVLEGVPIDIEKGKKFINGLLRLSREKLNELHQLAQLSSGRKEDSLSVHAVNIAINAIILGQGLGYKKKELEDLGTAALFHEIGMYMLPEQIRQKQGQLTEKERSIINGHCILAYEELIRYGKQYQFIAEIVRQEHERLDGSGYPEGLQDEQVHEHAYVLGLLDIYESLIQARPYREKFTPAEAIKEIIRRSKGLFPNRIIKQLLILWSFYPVQTFVRLNNNAVAMVVRTNPLWPLKPVVRLIQDSRKKPVTTDNIIDLSQTPLLYIAESLLQESLSSADIYMAATEDLASWSHH